MGLKRAYLDFIDAAVRDTVGGFEGMRLLELGNQRISRSARVGARTGKAYYSGLGAEHTSVDINGEDGAVVVDLGTPGAMPEWHGRFDIITNAGTTEHVEPFDAQYDCFRNIHEWSRPGGVIVNFVPGVEELDARGRWRHHCNTYYSVPFFDALAAACGYRVVATAVLNDLRAVAFERGDRPFMPDRERFYEHLARRSGGIDYADRSLLSRLKHKLKRLLSR